MLCLSVFRRCVLLMALGCVATLAAAEPDSAPVAEREFWSFQPLSRTEIGRLPDSEWVRNPIDRFLLAELEARGLSPNPPADARAVVRRASFDLTGLAPPPGAIDAVFQGGPAAYAQLLDRLLASPAYGERWARHWLDVARFAESDGFEHDDDRPLAYHFRDFVIRALNADMPFDQFVQWQLAGDEFAPHDPLALMATGFLTAGVLPTQITEAEFERTRYDQLDDMAATTGVAFLGLTIGCARCHDHKYDPISSREYYRLVSAFTTTVRSEVPVEVSALSGMPSDATEPVNIQVGSEGLKPAKNHADGRGYPHFYADTHFLIRGDPARKDGVAALGFPSILMRNGKQVSHWQTPPPDGWRTSYRRRALAAWLTDAEHGGGHLAARVIVNRLWHHHMGRGIVATPNDFGMQGERPTHPELLDWLAGELIRGGWRLAPIHRLIMSSSAYRQSSKHDPADARIDPGNRLWWRFSPRRLEAEAIRDTLLSIAGMLDTSMYGAGTLDESSRRRSIYFTVKRSRLIPSMQLFDSPESLVSIGARPRTTIAPQALMLLNSPFARRVATEFAQRIAPVAERGMPEAIHEAYLVALGRRPTETEVAEHLELLEADVATSRQQHPDQRRLSALTNFCQLLMCLNEFVYVE